VSCSAETDRVQLVDFFRCARQSLIDIAARREQVNMIEGIIDGSLNQFRWSIGRQVGVHDTVDARIFVTGVGKRDDAHIGRTQQRHLFGDHPLERSDNERFRFAALSELFERQAQVMLQSGERSASHFVARKKHDGWQIAECRVRDATWRNLRGRTHGSCLT